MIALPDLPGWRLLGAFPDGVEDDVGSWLLHADGEALLLEVPPGLTVEAVAQGLADLGVRLRFVTASHLHEDHLDPDAWNALIEAYPEAEFLSPEELEGDTARTIGGEPVWFVRAPKHSAGDMVTVFRGVAMTGDIELETLDSVNREVPRAVKAASMAYLGGFEERTGYGVHTIMSAHLNDFRSGVRWRDLCKVQ